MTGQKEEKKEYKKHENCRRRDRTESEALQEVLADLKMFQKPKMLRYLSHIRKEIVVGSLWKFLRGLIREKQLHGFPKDCPQQICAAVLLPGQMKH